MPRAVLDTNVLVSAAVYGGRPAQAVERCRRDDCVHIVSHPLLDELRRILVQRFLWTEPLADATVDSVLHGSVIVVPEFRLDACQDPDDDRVLECAVAGEADLIVTGDKDLLVMNPFQGIKIVTVRQFLDSHGA
jgi:hypothetical protein